MELSLQSIVKVIVAYVLIGVFLGLVGVHWKTRLRIIAAMVIGTILIGFLAYPLVRPYDPLDPITIFTGHISIPDSIICLVLAYIAGFAAFYACKPQGCEIAPIAAPAGLAVWALGPGDMFTLLRLNHTLAERQQLYGALKWEGLFWLAIIAAGFLGCFTARVRTKTKPCNLTETTHNSKLIKLLTILTGIFATGVLAHFAISIFAQDVKMHDQFGSYVGQPSVAQIAFAVLVSFTIASFVVKRFLDVSYIYCIIAAAGLVYFGAVISIKADVLSHMIENWPIAYFTRATSAILPIQMMSFATLGSVAGYWIAIRYAQMRRDDS
jgi:hypothetical protein